MQITPPTQHSVLLHPTYFGSIRQFVAIAKANHLVFERHDTYQKQTYRNRMYIYAANGKLLLSIPIKHVGKQYQNQYYKDVQIENDFNWQKQHWKSLETAYRSAPFFEFYEEELRPLYTEKRKFLYDYNLDSMRVALNILEIKIPFTTTTAYCKETTTLLDQRTLVLAKKADAYNNQTYLQVFAQKKGFLPNLSILDLIFNLGPAAQLYLQEQTL